MQDLTGETVTPEPTPEEIRNRPRPSDAVLRRVFDITEYAKLRRQQDREDAEPYHPGAILPRCDWGRLAEVHAIEVRAMTAEQYREAREACKWAYGGGISRSARPYIEELDAMRRPGVVAAEPAPPLDLTGACPLATPNTPEKERGRVIWDYIQVRRHIAMGARWDHTDMPPLEVIGEERAQAAAAMTGAEYGAALEAARMLYGGSFPPYAPPYLALLEARRRPRQITPKGPV